jgi:hypothetical protein
MSDNRYYVKHGLEHPSREGLPDESPECSETDWPLKFVYSSSAWLSSPSSVRSRAS